MRDLTVWKKSLENDAEALLARATAKRASAKILSLAGRAIPETDALLKSALRDVRKAGELFLIAGLVPGKAAISDGSPRKE